MSVMFSIWFNIIKSIWAKISESTSKCECAFGGGWCETRIKECEPCILELFEEIYTGVHWLLGVNNNISIHWGMNEDWRIYLTLSSSAKKRFDWGYD